MTTILKSIIFVSWPLTRTRADLLEKKPVNNLPVCPRCIGGRLVFNGYDKVFECPNCGHVRKYR